MYFKNIPVTLWYLQASKNNISFKCNEVLSGRQILVPRQQDEKPIDMILGRSQ